MNSQADTRLDRLHQNVTAMGGMCEDAIRLAFLAVSSPARESSAREAMALSGRIERLERELEAECLRILLLFQPVASDLRRVSAAIKAVSDLKRIGRHAADVAEIALASPPLPDRLSAPLLDMADRSAQMLTRAVDAFVRADLPLARSAIAADDALDSAFASLRSSLAASFTPQNANATLDALMIAKYFERIGDRTVSLARRVIFAATGSRET